MNDRTSALTNVIDDKLKNLVTIDVDDHIADLVRMAFVEGPTKGQLQDHEFWGPNDGITVAERMNKLIEKNGLPKDPYRQKVRFLWDSLPEGRPIDAHIVERDGRSIATNINHVIKTLYQNDMPPGLTRLVRDLQNWPKPAQQWAQDLYVSSSPAKQ